VKTQNRNEVLPSLTLDFGLREISGKTLLRDYYMRQ